MTGVTAEIAAKAVVAACGCLGGDPTRVFGDERGNHRIRALAAAGTARALSLTNKEAARAFQTLPTRLAPTQLVRHRITDEQVLAVALALDETASPGPRRAAASDAPAPTHKPAPLSSRPDRSPVPAPAPTPGPMRRPRPTDGPARPARQSAVGSTNPVRSTRVKAVTADMVRWTRQQVGLGVAVAFMADLFDVSAEDLAAALDDGPRLARAA